MNDESIIITDETKAIVDHYLAKRRKAYERRHPEALQQPVINQSNDHGRTIQNFILDHQRWNQETFKGQRPEHSILHLREEVEELLKDPRNPEEYADVFMMALSAMYLAGITFDQLLNEMYAKLNVCKRQKWYQTEQGYYKRMKPTFYMAVKEEI